MASLHSITQAVVRSVARSSIHAWRRGSCALVLVLAGLFPGIALAQNSVFLGQGLYTNNNQIGAGVNACSSCHFTNNPPSTPPSLTQGEGDGSAHPQAANRPLLITNAFATGGIMINYIFGGGAGFEGTPNYADKAFKLAMYIGQFKAPAFKTPAPTTDPGLSLVVRSGSTGSRDIFSRIVDDGTAGVASDAGLTVEDRNAARASAIGASQLNGTASLAYNISYTALSSYTGSDTFTVRVANPSLAAGVTQTAHVTVLGISNATLSVQGYKGQVYTAGAGALYKVTSNDAGAHTFTAGGNLPAGLAINSTTGDITGTPSVTGNFSVAIGLTTAGATHSGNAPVSRTLDIALAGVTSNAAVSYNQNASITPYSVATFPAAIANTYTINNPANLPPGLSYDTNTGVVSGTPTTSGVYNVVLGANTSAGAVTQNVQMTVISAGAPVITTTPPLPAWPASNTVAGTVNQPFPATQINATNPPIDPNSYTATGLPAGLSVSAATGLITGTPTVSGDFPLVLGATNSGGAGVGTQNITIRINPIIGPTVTSNDPPASNVNAPFGPYQITGSNGPILSYAIVGPSPAWLVLNTSTGVITGTPPDSGTSTINVTVTNFVGTSPPKTLTLTVNPTALPSITSPTFVSVAAGVPITPIQVVATNPTIIPPYLAVGLPPGLGIDPTSGVISGIPTTPGSFSATLTVNNSVGPNSRVVPFTIGVPAPLACALSVPLNTPTTLDLATCLFNGFSPTGVTIVSPPGHGSTVTSSTRVTYTPVNNYFGADSFTFVGTGAGGNSPVGTVTVTVTGRPDPTQDPAVTAMLAAQADTARRFATAQISNFTRRLEALHGSGRAPANPGTALQAQASPGAQDSGFAAAAVQAAGGATGTSSATGSRVATLSSTTSPVAQTPRAPGPVDAATAMRNNQRPQEITEAQAIDTVASGLGVKSLPFAESMFSLIKSRSVNLSGVGSGLGLNVAPGTSGSTSYWIEGVASFGTRDASGGTTSSEFSSDGITIGADRRLSDQLAVGMGLGYARGTDKIGTDGSNNRSKGYSLALYGSYQPSRNTFVDAMLGFGSLDFDSKRYVAPINDFAYGRRDGTQFFGSLSGGYEFRDEALLVSPYARLDFSYNRLRSATETGAGAYALTYFGQNTSSVQGVLGVRGETVQSTDFGYAVPRLRAEFRHEFQGTGQAFIGYADQPGGTRYALTPGGTARDAIVLGVGSDFLFRNGITLGLEYQLAHSFGNESSYAVRLRLSKEFDAAGMPKLLGDVTARRGKPIDVQVEAGYTHDDNVTRAKAEPDKLSDDSYAITASKNVVLPLSEQSRVILTGSFGGEKFHHFNGLSRINGGLEAEYQYRESSEFDEPTWGAFAKLSGEGFETRLRDGYRVSVGLSIRQPLSDRINLFASLSHNRREARSDVFSTRDNSLRTNIDYTLGDKHTLYLGAEYRRGDVVSTGRASLENVSIAKVFTQDDAYPGGQLFSYKFDGSTVLTTLGYNLELGPRDSLDFSWRFIRSTPGLRPAFVTSARSYKANQLSAVYLMRF